MGQRGGYAVHSRGSTDDLELTFTEQVGELSKHSAADFFVLLDFIIGDLRNGAFGFPSDAGIEYLSGGNFCSPSALAE